MCHVCEYVVTNSYFSDGAVTNRSSIAKLLLA